MDHERIQRAANAIAEADGLLISAGAGMGVDSGLPDFRGDQGFWKAYPPYAKMGMSFSDLANPTWFRTDPTLAWGFYGHRLNLYRATQPHGGFALLKSWAERKPNGAFVFTSNVDGAFQKAGFDANHVCEVHGAIDWMQCTEHCGVGIYPATDVRITIDESTMRAVEPLPHCPQCGALARPNILMFGDADWNEARSYPQENRLNLWLGNMHQKRLTVIECGAGSAIPTVRRLSEQVVRTHRATLVRINIREDDVPVGQIGIPMGALAALQAIQAAWPTV